MKTFHISCTTWISNGRICLQDMIRLIMDETADSVKPHDGSFVGTIFLLLLIQANPNMWRYDWCIESTQLTEEGQQRVRSHSDMIQRHTYMWWYYSLWWLTYLTNHVYLQNHNRFWSRTLRFVCGLTVLSIIHPPSASVWLTFLQHM